MSNSLHPNDEVEARALQLKSEQWQTFSSLPTTQLRAILTQEQNNIHALRERLSAAEEKIAILKTILSPFSSLPQELISEVFQFYCAAQGVIYDAFQKRKMRTRPSKIDPDRIISGVYTIPPQLILTQVCSYWRTVAHATRFLWTRLTMYIQSGKFAHHEELITNWFEYTGQNLPLDISLFVPKGKGQVTKSFINAIIPYADRWRRLELSAPLQTFRPLFIQGPLNAPLLEHVRLNICHFTDSSMQAYSSDVTKFENARYIVFNNAPKLYSFDCGTTFDCDSDHDDEFSFLSILPDPLRQIQTITHLAMRGDSYVPSSHGGLSFLRVFTMNLVSLTVKVSPGASEIEVPLPLTFPKLRSLSVVVTYPQDGEHFFRQLTLPLLEAFELTLEKDYLIATDVYGEIMRMQTRSSFVLKEIAIYNGSNACNLCAFLQSMDSVRRLTLSSLHSSNLQAAVTWLSETTALLFLEELHLLGGQVKAGSENPLTGLVDILDRRAHLPGNLTGPCRNLRLLDIQLSKTAFERMDDDELDLLQKYKKLGLDVRLHIWLSHGILVNAVYHDFS